MPTAGNSPMKSCKKRCDFFEFSANCTALSRMFRPRSAGPKLRPLGCKSLRVIVYLWHDSRGIRLKFVSQNSSVALSILRRRHPVSLFWEPWGCFDFLYFFLAPRNRARWAWSVGPTIRAGLACGIVKLKLDLAGSRKRPRLVFAWSRRPANFSDLPCVF